MKTCPFCKNIISKDSDICPHCRRILVERIGPVHKQQSNTTHKKIKKPIKKIKIKLKYLTKDFKWNNLKKYIPIFILLFLIIFIIYFREEKHHINTTNNSNPISVIPKDENIPFEQNNHVNIVRVYNSLPNGSILYKNTYYLNGLGKLNIENGTSLDAIAKLVNTTTNKSVFTVYIKSNSSYNINKILKGKYKLFFNLGNDWNDKIKAFTVNSSYEVFEEDFNFIVRETREYEEYSTFKVTLNPVIGGQAKTDDVSAIEFSKY